MEPSYEEIWEGFLSENMEFTSLQWESSEEYKQIEQKRFALQKRILCMIPQKHHKKAILLLDDLFCLNFSGNSFYYMVGFQEGIRHLKMLGLL